MCGIFGYISNDTLAENVVKTRINKLFHLSESRGKEAAGICISYKDNLHVYKDNIPASTLIKTQEYRAFFQKSFKNEDRISSHFSIIGHSRLVTNGSDEWNFNNQPVIKDDFVVVHNGIVTNVETLYARHPEIERKYEIDTEIFPSLLRNYFSETNNIITALQKTLAEIEGTISIAALPCDYDATILITNNGSLYFCHDRLLHQSVFASEEFILEQFIKNLENFSKDDICWIPPHSGIIVENSTMAIHHFNIKNKKLAIKLNPLDSTSLIKDFSKSERQTVPSANTAIKTTNPHLLEFNLETINRLQRCSKCLLPETFPFIQFDAQGICNYCHNYKKRYPSKEYETQQLEKFKQIVGTYQKKGQGDIDVVVAFSGGRDSSYGLHYITKELGLKPVTFTYDWGMVTDLARRNIARICGKLGIENILVSADIRKKRRYIRQNVSAWLKQPELGMIPIFMAGDKYFFHHVNRIKKQIGVDLNIWMGNRFENTDFKFGFAGLKPQHDKKYLYSISFFDKIRLPLYYLKNYACNPSYFNSSMLDTIGAYYVYYAEPRNDAYLLYDYLKWDESNIENTLIQEYNWETAPDTKSTWRIGDGTAAFYNYVYYTVAGFTENDTFRSNQIREGMLTREKALEFVNEENRPRYDSIKWYLDTINLDFESTIQRINQIPKLYQFLY